MNPDWSAVTPQALEEFDLESRLAGVAKREAFDLAMALNRQTIDGHDETELTCHRFCVAVLQMVLHSNNAQEPFGAMFELIIGSSPGPKNFTKSTLAAIEPWANSLKCPELRARFLDLIWTKAKSHRAALQAVPSYIEASKNFSSEHEYHAKNTRLERAIRLAASLGRGDVSRDLKKKALDEVLAWVVQVTDTTPSELFLSPVRLLLEFEQGEPAELAERCLRAARSTSDVSKNWLVRSYYDLAADCARAAGDKQGEQRARQDAAEALVTLAEHEYMLPTRGAGVASAIMMDAVQAMRAAPGAKERIAELHHRLLEMQEEAMTQMASFSFQVDLREPAEMAIAAVRDKSFREAVNALCGVYSTPAISRLTSEALVTLKEASLFRLVPRQIVKPRGRIIGQIPPYVDGVTDIKDRAFRSAMYTNARHDRSRMTRGAIDAARRQILQEHFPTHEDIVDVIRLSHWIPPGHLNSVAKGVLAGFHGDMIVAAHIVPVQLEAMVRRLVELNGGVTTTLGDDDLQMERPLKSLLDAPELKEMLGPDAIFELYEVLADPISSNLRNEAAHGMLTDSDMFSDDVLYAWWLLLKHCYMSARYSVRVLSRKD